jgi:hypothetical protein
MFSKTSRYRKLPDVATADAKGRSLRSKALRPLPQVSGEFFHTVEEIDRLDHLAFKYYRQPQKWWRICDANPEFLSPQALLGKEPIVTERFPLAWDDEAGQPPWAELRRRLLRDVGVLDLQTVEEVHLVPEVRTIGDKQVTVHVELYERAAVVTYNRMNTEAETLADLIAAVGFGVGQPERVGRVGKRIVIPPAGTG